MTKPRAPDWQGADTKHAAGVSPPIDDGRLLRRKCEERKTWLPEFTERMVSIIQRVHETFGKRWRHNAFRFSDTAGVCAFKWIVNTMIP